MHYHIVGIAGAGMSAIANMLLDEGHRISGSDLSTNQLTVALTARGATIYAGHDPRHIAGADAVVVTSAAPAEHPEVVAARHASIPLLKRDHLWRTWSQQRPIIAIAGTHGKTTTTTMIALVLTRAGYHPGFFIGAESPDLGTNGRWGNPTAPLVIEADEYDHAFLSLTPEIAVITNIEWDHPDIYASSEAYDAAFVQFASQTRGTLLVCGDSSSHAWDLISNPSSSSSSKGGMADNAAQLLSYGLEPANHYRAEAREQGDWHISRETLLCTLSLSVPGRHNVSNALAALAVAHLLDLDLTQATATLAGFRGAARRFEFKGEAAGITVIDDYAHHPTEVRTTLAAARARYPDRRIVAYVQPHTYSRTRTLLNDWQGAFPDADLVAVGDVYPAREIAPEGERLKSDLARDVTTLIAARHPYAVFVGNIQQAVTELLFLLRPGDVLLTLGAGDGYLVGETLLQQLATKCS